MDDEVVPLRARQVAPGGPVPERVLASWQRSEDYGVPLDEVDPAFAGAVDTESLFFECGREVLGGLHATLASEPVSLMLTDHEGLVLDRLCGDSTLLRALDRVHLAPGFAFSERDAGTNGLALALADRVPTLVHAEQHYSASLCGYTCAAVPVHDPVTGRLEGSVNLTTWSRSSSDLLLALAQSAAGTTAALMLARSQGRSPRPQPRGQVYRVESARAVSGSATLAAALSAAWNAPVAEAAAGLAAGHVVLVLGEPGSGRATLGAQALRQVSPRDRILSATPPDPRDVDAWLDLWTPELGKAGTGFVVADVDTLPLWAAERLRDLLAATGARGGAASTTRLVLTAQDLHDVPASLAPLVGAVVGVPPLRERPDDVVPLAAHLGRRHRGRDLGFTPAAERVLRDASWPDNVDQLARVVRDAGRLTDVVDVRHLPADLRRASAHRLTRLESVERDEIARALARPGATVTAAARELGLSRATMYRKLAHYDLSAPGRQARER